MTSPSVAACCSGLYELPLTKALLGDSFHPGGRRLSNELADMTVAGRGTRVLDLACGIGTTSGLLAADRGCEVTGLDYSARNAAAARDRVARNATFGAGDATVLPFAAEVFDVVMCECALCTFDDQARALDEVMRVLRPGGRVGISDMTLETAIPPELDNVMGHVLCIAGARTTTGYTEALREAGFQSVRSRDRGSVLLDTIARIERNVATIERLADMEDMPPDLGDPRPVLDAARRFVNAGGLSYALITARKPFDGR